jgi:TniQ
MRDVEIYGAWEASRPAITHRSYFYPLAPIGVGTAAVESLTGYISRLAAAHVVDTGTLVNRELLSRVPYTKGVWTGQAPPHLPGYSFYIGAHTLNGVGYRTQLWVTLLQQLTCVLRLDLLTTLPWAGAIACVRLLRSHRAWCSYCFGDEGASAPTAYERLAWGFQAVTVCPAHRQPLESVCPFRGRMQYVLSARSRPGYCSRCYHWLGRMSDGTMVHSDLTEQIRVAEMLGDLLVASPNLPAHFGLDLFRKNVRGLVRDAGGYRRFHAGIQRPYVRDWVRRPILPRMNSLIRLSSRQQVPLVRLLTERIEAGNKRDQKCAWKTHYRVESRIVEATLAAASNHPRRSPAWR